MSQSSRISKEFGALSLSVDRRLVTGSTGEVVPTYTPAPTSFADADDTVTTAQVKTGMFSMTPTAARTLTLPTATLLSSFLDVVGKTVDITIVNLGADATSVVIATGAGGTLVGSSVVRDSNTTTDSDSGSALFRIRMTNVSTPAYTVYRVC